MKEIYLTKSQIGKLVAGKQVVFSRGGKMFALADRSLKKEAQSKRQKEIQTLKARSEVLEKGKTSPGFLFTYKPCDICKKPFKKLGLHISLKHGGRPSNLPHVRLQQAR